jgi:hypothetical protein
VDELEIRMREVLLQLALTSNGRTSSFNSSGGSQHDYTPTLGAGDAPHLHFAKLWDAAQDDGRRRTILRDAKDVLKTLRQSRGDRTRVESEKELFTRIVNRGEGIGAQELATRMRCGVTLVRKARAEEGRETEYGRAPRNGHELLRQVVRGGCVPLFGGRAAGESPERPPTSEVAVGKSLLAVSGPVRS